MRNGRKPRMTLQTLATIAMNLFTICCACYIMTIIWSRIDPRATFISRHTGVVCGIMAITPSSPSSSRQSTRPSSQ